MAVTFPQKL